MKATPQYITRMYLEEIKPVINILVRIHQLAIPKIYYDKNHVFLKREYDYKTQSSIDECHKILKHIQEIYSKKYDMQFTSIDSTQTPEQPPKNTKL